MTKLPSPAAVIFTVSVIAAVIFPVQSLGSGGTVAVSYDPATVCGIVAVSPIHYIRCHSNGQIVAVNPNVSFSAVSGGRGFFCGVRSGGRSLLCWDAPHRNKTLAPKRLYYSNTVLIENLSVGEDHVCATVAGSGAVKCWRTGGSLEPSEKFGSISSGSGFSCGITSEKSLVRCWGTNPIADRIEREFGNIPMATIAAGSNHVCGLNTTGFVLCRGMNDSGQLNVPSSSSVDLTDLSLGASHSCAIRRSNGTVICWGGSPGYYSIGEAISFESIVSGSNFTCGLTTSNFSIICWGPGSPSRQPGLYPILPGPCVSSTSACDCGVFPQSQSLCSSSSSSSSSGEVICKKCDSKLILVPTPSPPSPLQSNSSPVLRKSLLAFVIVGSVGAVSAICTIIWCLWTGVCFGDKKIHNSVQPTITITRANSRSSNPSQVSRSSTIRRQASRTLMRRQRSGTSSNKHADRAEPFTFSELASATANFSPDNKIGSGSFGVVYRGKLGDGREVAIKRGETNTMSTKNKFQEKELAFESELAFLSRLHHKNLVRLVGYCEEEEERLLVYEFMKNGSLHDHLHNREKSCSSSVINSWRVRIGIALDAARGIEYLHSYAVPPIIHRDIKSSNILIDENWVARVSDFGLSLMGGQEKNLEYRPMRAVGTVGYIDPEYYGLNVLTAKSDVYGLGVVLLELLTGRRAIFSNGGGGAPESVVDFAVPAILAGELGRVLDDRVGAPGVAGEAVELVAYTAVHCVNLEGRERPTMGDIVANLERALVLCEEGSSSHGSVSSGGLIVPVGSD